MKYILLLAGLVAGASSVTAQPAAFKEPKFAKVEKAGREAFTKRFEKVKWTGQGLDKPATIDQIPTQEIRARLQKVFGDPTQKVEDLVTKSDFHPGNYIQFEYWFAINFSIPLMILDVDGPFANGLVYGGDAKYVDLMPEIKRALSKKLMDVTQFADFNDVYFDYDNGVWYEVKYEKGAFSSKKIQKPAGIKMPGQ